jgi:L,D-transpeptidase YcbB
MMRLADRSRYAAMVILALAAAFLITAGFAVERLAGAELAAADIRALLSKNIRGGIDADPAVSARLRSLYAERDYRPLWTGNAANEEEARLAREVLARADEEGLDPGDYSAAPLPRTAREHADADVTLTLNLLSYMRDAGKGRLPPGAVYRDIDLPETEFDSTSELASALTEKRLANLLGELPPPHPQYQGLVQALKRYRSIAAQGGWPSIPGTDEVKTGDGGERLSLLKQRLAAEDREFARLSAPGDSDVIAAIKRYQARNGLNTDGRAGRRTLDMLNISARPSGSIKSSPIWNAGGGCQDRSNAVTSRSTPPG